jgi:hypothetical protein
MTMRSQGLALDRDVSFSYASFYRDLGYSWKIGRNSMKKLIAILILAALLAYGALNYHFIRTDKGLRVLKKVELTLDDTFVDARGDKKVRLLLNPALMKAGLKELLGEASDSIK